MSDRPEQDAQGGGESEERHDITAELLALLHDNAEEAEKRFRTLVSDLTWYLERRRCHDPEGTASEAVWRALDKARKGEVNASDSGFRRLVFRIASNVCHEGWRHAKRMQQLDPGMLDYPEPGGAKGQANVEVALIVEQARRHLTTEEWNLLERYYTEDDHEAQARELGVKPGTLRVRAHRAILKLRNYLIPERKRKKA